MPRHRRWPKVEIAVRGDSGFARENLLGYCEGKWVDYIFGLARTISCSMEKIETGEPVRAYGDFRKLGRKFRS